MKNIYLCFILTFSSFLPSIAQEKLTLQDAVAQALENNFSIKISKTNVALAENNYTLGNAGFLPVVDVSASQTNSINNVNQVFLTGPPNERINAKTSTSSAGINLNWTIFDGLGMFMVRNGLEQNIESGKANLKITVQNTVRDVYVAYYNIIQQNQRLKSLQNNLLISNSRLTLAKDKYEIGTVSKVEYLNAQVDYNTDKSAILRQEQSITNSKIRLNRILAREVNVDFQIEDSIIIKTDLQLDELSTQAKKNNLEIQAAEINKNIAEYQFKDIKSQRYPTISLNSSYNFVKSTSQAGFLQSSQSYGLTYGISARMNVFNGFNQRRLEQNAQISIDLNDQNIGLLELQLDAQISETYNNYRNGINLANIEKENLVIALQNVDIALDRYKIGVSTPIELREVQRNVVATESRLIDAVYEAKIAEIELLRLNGELIK